MTSRRFLVLALGLFACTGQQPAAVNNEPVTNRSSEEAPARVSFTRDIAPILALNCSTGYCHPGNYAPMSLLPEDVVETLIGVPSSCPDGRARVSPGNPDPEDSYLMAKITGEALCNDSGVMPPRGRRLPDDAIALFRAWIAEGAHHD